VNLCLLFHSRSSQAPPVIVAQCQLLIVAMMSHWLTVFFPYLYIELVDNPCDAAGF
jgi:hypothetical protein